MKTVPPPKAPKVMEPNKVKPGGIHTTNHSVPSASGVKRPGKSKVRAVPDFSKLHKKWEKHLQQGKACTKKPCTKVEEFHLSTPGTTTECTPTVLNNMPKEQENQENITPPPFKPDPQALKSITSGKGIAGRTPGRATLAGPSRPSMRVPVSEAANSKSCAVSKVKVAAKQTATTENEKGSGGMMKFEADSSALQSILQNQGLTACPGGVIPARQTLAAPQRTPVAARPSNAGRCTDVMRRSIYYTGPKTTSNSRREFYTEFTQNIVSRLAPPAAATISEDGASPKPTFVKPLPVASGPATPKPVVLREKGSIYCKVQYFDRMDPKTKESDAANLAPMNSLRTATPRTNTKAARIPVGPTPAKTPGTATKARRVLRNGVPCASAVKATEQRAATPQKDKLATHLLFQDDEEEDDDDDDERLQTLEEAEKRLEAEIAAARSNSSPEVEQSPDPSPSTETISVRVNKPTRVAFGVLSKEEIARRSEPGYNPKNACKSMGPTIKFKVSTPPKKPTSPLRYRDLPSPRSQHRASPRTKRPQSPLVTSERKGRVRSKAAPKDLDATMDIVTVSALDRSTLETSVNSSYSSPSGLGKSPKGMSPARCQALEYQVRQVAAVLDKENSPFGENSPLAKIWDKENMTPKANSKLLKGDDLEKYKLDDALLALCSPNSKDNLTRLSLCSPNKRPREEKTSPLASPKIRCQKLSPKSLFNCEAFKRDEKNKDKKDKKKVHFDKKEESKKNDMSIEDISKSISQTKTQIDDLNQKAATHIGGSDPKVQQNWILKQMEEIRERQEQLLTLQLQLQSQLQKQSPSSSASTARDDSLTTSLSTTANNSPTTAPSTTTKDLLQTVTPSTPASNSQSYADFIAAHVEDISPYIPENTSSRMPFDLCVGAERESRKRQQAIEEQTVPIQVANSVLDDSLKSSDKAGTPLKAAVAWSPAVYSPKPIMAGLHQLLQSVSPAPIHTPLALRSMAERVQPQRDLLEISSTESSMLETSKLFPTPEYVSDSAEQTVNLPQTPARSLKGQANIGSLMTTTLSFASPRSSPTVKSSKGSLSLAANLSPRASTVTSPIVSSVQTTPFRPVPSSFETPVQAHTTTATATSKLTPMSKPCAEVGLRHSTILAQTVARFHEALLDDEVALYACRMARKRDTPDVERTVNPVATTLTDGDEMHFIPIHDDPQCVPSFASVDGSAFTLPQNSAFCSV